MPPWIAVPAVSARPANCRRGLPFLQCLPGLQTLFLFSPAVQGNVNFLRPLIKLLAMLSNGFFQRLDKLLIVDPAVAGHPGTHIAIEVIAIFILIIDQHFELFFRLLTSATDAE